MAAMVAAPVDEGDLGVDAAVTRARVAEKAGLHRCTMKLGKNFAHEYSLICCTAYLHNMINDDK